MTLKLVCKWCEKTIREGDDGRVSDGICPACCENLLSECRSVRREVAMDEKAEMRAVCVRAGVDVK